MNDGPESCAGYLVVLLVAGLAALALVTRHYVIAALMTAATIGTVIEFTLMGKR
jgi:hypothetical protein